jgi:hypothetical protein
MGALFRMVMGILRRSGHSGDNTPSVASRPSPVIHDRSFVRFDEILDLVRPHPGSARRVRRARGVTLTATLRLLLRASASLRPGHHFHIVAFGACTSKPDPFPLFTDTEAAWRRHAPRPVQLRAPLPSLGSRRDHYPSSLCATRRCEHRASE